MDALTPIMIDRFWSKVKMSNADECWSWTGALDRYGYGQFKGKSGETPKRAHRIAYFLKNGSSCSSDVIRHLCGNRACCNPSHLAPGTQADNHADRVSDGNAGRDDNGRFITVRTTVK